MRIALSILAGLLLLVGAVVIGCSDPEPEQKVSAKIAHADKARVAELMPLLQKHLPGLTKYKDSLSLEKVYPMLYYPTPGSGLPEEMSVLWVVYRVPQDDSRIPTKYRANGHNLFIGVDESSRYLILKKGTTMSVMLDRLVQSGGKDMVIGL